MVMRVATSTVPSFTIYFGSNSKMSTSNTTTREEFRAALRNTGLKKVEDDILSKGTVFALCVLIAHRHMRIVNLYTF
jgi:hypothetical protein